MPLLADTIKKASSHAAFILGWILIVLFASLCFDVLWGVFSRYVLGTQGRWTEEIAVYLLIWISLLGAALTYRENGHLGFDYLVSHLHPDARKIAAICSELICMIFIGYVLIYGGSILVLRALANGQTTPALSWQTGYLYSTIPLSGIFFILFACEHLCQPLTQQNYDDS